uniref:Hermansky-Pudlak syndrome 5 protein homolog n=1 Tax=Salarias fasciatus TaxID=181472 RepID=A0A672GNU3_SALFA
MSPIPVVPENYSHVLAEFDCLDPLLSALRLDSGRLKCTCLAVSRKWLALGTSAGGLHLIQREGWKQRLILTHKEGSIIQVACCPHNEDFIAVATSQGLVVVWELQLERRGRPDRVSSSWEHKGQTITALCWDTSALRVFVGDAVGKVSYLRAGSSKTGKGAAFVIFPVQTVTTVDSKVVQLGYQDGRLLVSSLSRCYLCDTEKEKFWRVGHKERDGEYGACFFPQNRGLLVGQPPLLYCARPGSRVWEASFNGEVLSTHQFKQLLACPPLPLISSRSEPCYSPVQRSPQSVAFPKMLYLGDQNLLTWTDSAIYIFTPQNGQVLLWTEVKDLVDVAIYRSELFCLHGGGRLSHLSLLSAERCVERLLRRDRVRFIAKLEPLDSACSSRRSSISSHESFNVLDCGIYRVISRRGSQSDEETGSLINQSMSEEERLKEFSFAQEEDPVDSGERSDVARADAERSEQGLPFHLPLSFRPKPPRIALQAVKDSVSSFVKKTTEKINTLQMNSELWQRPEFREGGQAEMLSGTTPYSEETDNEVYDEMSNNDSDMQELRSATERTIQDPLVLLDPVSLGEALQEWLPVLQRILGPAAASDSAESPGEEKRERGHANDSTDQQEPADVVTDGACDSPELGGKEEPCEEQLTADATEQVSESRPEPVRVASPKPVPPDLQADLTELATLYAELSCFRNQGGDAPSCRTFLRRYFFLLDQERMRRMCLLCRQEQPGVQSSFTEAMLELTRGSRVVDVIQRGDLLKSLRSLRELQPRSAPLLLAHLHRLYEKHGEAAVRSFSQFYPTIIPADILAMAQESHFLAYLDNLVQSQTEEHRLSFLQSLLEPESLRQDWLLLALTHDAPQRCDTLTPDGNPRWHSHCFSWGYGRLLSLLVRLPADLPSKRMMAETCRSHGYWTGYLYLCQQLQHRSEAFSTICQLDDVSLLEEPDGVEPQTLDEWKFLMQRSQQCSSSSADRQQEAGVNGGGWSNGSADAPGKIDPESLTLMLARTAGPDRALAVLEECGIQLTLSPHSTLVCELLRVTEKRQRWVTPPRTELPNLHTTHLNIFLIKQIVGLKILSRTSAVQILIFSDWKKKNHTVSYNHLIH